MVCCVKGAAMFRFLSTFVMALALAACDREKAMRSSTAKRSSARRPESTFLRKGGPDLLLPHVIAPAPAPATPVRIPLVDDIF